jgi:hypothetical protein
MKKFLNLNCDGGIRDKDAVRSNLKLKVNKDTYLKSQSNDIKTFFESFGSGQVKL